MQFIVIQLPKESFLDTNIHRLIGPTRGAFKWYFARWTCHEKGTSRDLFVINDILTPPLKYMYIHMPPNIAKDTAIAYGKTGDTKANVCQASNIKTPSAIC